MKSKWNFIASVFQLIVGILAILSFIFLGLDGEDMVKWTVTLILAIAYVIIGITGIILYR